MQKKIPENKKISKIAKTAWHELIAVLVVHGLESEKCKHIQIEHGTKCCV